MALAKELLLEWEISLKEKYLSHDKEKRIRRMQFFYRNLIPGILLGLFLMLPSMLIPESFSFYGTVVFNLIYIGLIFKYYPVIIKKRAQDFWKEWKIETWIILYGSIIGVLINTYTSYLLSNKWLEAIWEIINITKYSSAISGVVFIVFLYVLFRPWTKGVNKNWEQKYYNIKFLG